MITLDEILRGQPYPLNLKANLDDLLLRLNAFRALYGRPMICTSGYRTETNNRKVGGAKNSAHLYGQAADFLDRDQSLAKWIMQDLTVLDQVDLWMEDPSRSVGWIHLQSRPVQSGRVFLP